MLASHTIAISIARAPRDVAAFVADLRNMPQWAGAFCKAVRQVGNEWRVDTGQGEVGLRFTGDTRQGVLDHEVTLGDGLTVQMPLRVVPNQEGSEVLFTLFRLPGMSDERLAQDMDMMRADLQQLKQVLEGGSFSPP
jgi:hypothetical protein